jgi:hypothetical protein
VSLVVGWRINASLLGFAQRSNTDMRSVKSKEDKPVSDQYTIAASLAIRSNTLSLSALAPLNTAIVALIAGAVITAFIGAV